MMFPRNIPNYRGHPQFVTRLVTEESAAPPASHHDGQMPVSSYLQSYSFCNHRTKYICNLSALLTLLHRRDDHDDVLVGDAFGAGFPDGGEAAEGAGFGDDLSDGLYF